MLQGYVCFQHCHEVNATQDFDHIIETNHTNLICIGYNAPFKEAEVYCFGPFSRSDGRSVDNLVLARYLENALM